MLYVPPISDYKPFYVQFPTGSAQDIQSTFSVTVKAHDYPSAYKAKEPYKNQWKDEHGDDEYIPTTGLLIEAFIFKMKCVMFAKASTEEAAIEDLNEGIRAFRSAMSSGFLKTYDAYTGFGFQMVRLVEFQQPGQDDYDVFYERFTSPHSSVNNFGVARVIFDVTLKVNDPVTHMVLDTDSSSSTYNKIVEG